MSLTPAELQAFVTELERSPERWEPFVRHDGERVYELIWDDGEVNAWVICWSEDADTGFHDHDVSAASIRVLSGSVREDRLALAGSPRSRTFSGGQTFLVEPEAIHRVLHAGSGPAVTIHAYSPPLRRTGAYREGPGGVLQRESQSFEVELRTETEPILA